MATIAISAEIDVSAAPADVAAVLFDPAREPQWLSFIKHVELIDPALQPGARVTRQAAVMGRTMAWTTTVESVHFPHALNMRFHEGPFVGTMAYAVQRTATGSHVRVRGEGEAKLPAFVPMSVVESGINVALADALGKLKALVEGA